MNSQGPSATMSDFQYPSLTPLGYLKQIQDLIPFNGFSASLRIKIYL